MISVIDTEYLDFLGKGNTIVSRNGMKKNPVQSHNGHKRTNSRRPKKNSTFRRLVKLLRYILPYFLILIFIFVIVKTTGKSLSYADGMVTFLSILLTVGVAGEFILNYLKIRHPTFCLVFVIVLIALLFNAVCVKAKFEDMEKEQTQKTPDTASEVPAPAPVPFSDWKENPFLFNLSVSTEEDVMALLLEDARQYTDGTSIRPAKLPQDELNSGSYGIHVKKAQELHKDRESCKNESMIACSITLEIDQRKLAHALSQEADNAKELGSLYVLNANPAFFPDTDQYVSLKTALTYFIQALELSYADGYTDDYQREIWKSIRDTYMQLSTLSALDNLQSQQAVLISSSITNYWGIDG